MSKAEILEHAAIRSTPIAMDHIDLGPGPYCMSYGYDEKRLMGSIQRVGLLNPPSLVRNGSGGYDVVSGYRRLVAARSLGRKEILCRDLSDLKMTTFDLLHLNLFENLATRRFNEVEKAMALKRLSFHISQGRLIQEYLPLLGLSPHEAVLRAYLLFEELGEPLKQGLAEGMISSHVADLLQSLDPVSRSAIYDCISRLKLNYNYQKQLIEYLVEISEIEGHSIPQLLRKESLSRILMKEDQNNPQKAKSLMAGLRAIRNPRVTDYEHRFRKQLSSIPLPPGARIIHSPFFEGPSLTLEVSFVEGRNLKRKLLEIAETGGIENIRPPWLSQHDK